MLGKLLKYEWKATWKFLLPMNLVIVLMSFFAFCIIKLSFFDSDNTLILMTGTFIMMAYVISMIVVSAATMIFLVYRAYRSTYGEEGYLLHTLPIDKHHIIIAKTLISAAWILLNFFLIYFSVIFLFSTETEIVENMLQGIKSYMELMNGDDVLHGFDIFMTVLAGVVTIFAQILKIGACISLGQLSSNHKVLSAIGFYYGIYFLQNIFRVIYFVMISIIGTTLNSSYTSMTLGVELGMSWSVKLFSGLLYCVIFYLITWYVMEKKLNLE